MIKLNTKSGNQIPLIGLGTYPFQEEQMAYVIKDAIKVGYRLFDTSDDYRGESGIGIAVKELAHKGSVRREDLFLQTKISDNNAYDQEPLKGIFFNPHSRLMKRHSVEEVVREKVEKSLREMQTDYLDSLLIHYPFPNYFVEVWKVMIELKKEEKVRYIGVSNFHERHIRKLIYETGVRPEINEIYVSPFCIKESLVRFCNEQNCLVISYSPLMGVVRSHLLQDRLVELCQKYKKTLAQIILRWNIERGCLPLPRSKNLLRLSENFEIFDFSLTQEEIALISSLNADRQYLVESKICPGL